MARRILFADNNADFLSTRAEFLSEAGYEVHAAVSPVDAREKLGEHWYHLAILDNRLVDDDDPKDLSGLWLAREKSLSHIPRIILTAYEADLYSALVPPDVDVFRKQDDPDSMVRRVNQLFSEKVGINWNLKIVSPTNISAGRLLQLIEQSDNPPNRLERLQELEDLIRKAFYDSDTLIYRQILWQREGRVSLVVSATRKNASPDVLLVTIGARRPVIDEAAQYRRFAPKALGETGTDLQTTHETTHFAANIFSIYAMESDEIATLDLIPRSGDPKELSSTLKTLAKKTLAAWHREGRAQSTKCLDTVYRERLGLGAGQRSCHQLRQRLKELVTQSGRIGWRFVWHDEHLTLRQGEKQHQYANPLPLILEPVETGEPSWTIIVPGGLSGTNVAGATGGRARVTDFLDAGPAPMLWNFTSLEAMARFDWLEALDAKVIHELETCLTDSRIFGRIESSTSAPPTRQWLRTIHEIRSLAMPTIDQDIAAYHRGMFFHAARRLVEFNPDAPLEKKQLMRYAHLLLATAILSTNRPNARPERGFRFDPGQHGAWVDGQFVRLTPTEYKVLELLHNNDGICTRAEILQAIDGDDRWKREDPVSVQRKLDTAMSRIRRQLGGDPIETVPRVGYRLRREAAGE